MSDIDVQLIIDAYDRANDDLDRLRMAAGEDFRMPVELLIGEVEGLFSLKQRAYEAMRHPDPVVARIGRWICCDDEKRPD